MSFMWKGISKKSYKQIEKDIISYKEDIKSNPNLPDTYNILDSLLNHKRYNIFGKFMEYLYKYWITSNNS
ncbi:hypothetical protein PIROE2DRAFT_16997 [Piromyces sp. E2]|nr:hypothetical protein PIROE2DRAFT_16997 [Piromyces sp. E2]|eukprot:OUM57884.1 hypothetical protein PIROE2DRAFT_16997 [Piromyces sp. E2]